MSPREQAPDDTEACIAMNIEPITKCFPRQRPRDPRGDRRGVPTAIQPDWGWQCPATL